MQRWAALDRLRALAVLLMIQGHTFTALLRAGELSSGFARLHSLLHGLTGPAFLLGAGLAFGVTTYPRFAQHQTFAAASQARFRRYFFVFVLGYVLQLPGASLTRAFAATGTTLELVTRVGPLQLIALTLALAQASAWLLPTARSHAWCMGVLGFAILAFSPSIYEADFSRVLHPFWAAYLDDRRGSQYPIFPHASFPLLGVMLGRLAVERAPVMRGLSLAGLGATVSAGLYFAFEAGLIPYDGYIFWHASPAFMLFRAGLVIFTLGALHYHRDTRSASVPSSLFATLARHSLIAYVVHLLLLYGTPFSRNFARHYANSLNLATCSAAALFIVVVTVAVTRGYQWLARERQATVRWLTAGLTLLGLAMLVR